MCCGTELGAGTLSGHQWVPVIPNEIAHKELKRADFVVPPLTRFRTLDVSPVALGIHLGLYLSKYLDPYIWYGLEMNHPIAGIG